MTELLTKKWDNKYIVISFYLKYDIYKNVYIYHHHSLDDKGFNKKSREGHHLKTKRVFFRKGHVLLILNAEILHKNILLYVFLC